MINAKLFLQMIFIAGLLTLGACAGPHIPPFPEGHPADTGLREPTTERSMTLADPDPVDTAPARSEHFDQNGHDHNGHDMHEDTQPEQKEHHRHEMNH